MSMTPHDGHRDQDTLPRTETPEEAEALCDRLMEHTGDLIALLERETALLRQGRPQEITTLNARKTALSAALTHDLSRFRQDSEYIRTAAPHRIDAVREQHLHLQKSLETNQEALSAMKAVSESLLHTIAAKVGEQRAGPSTYGKNAALSGAEPTAPAAISFDRNL